MDFETFSGLIGSIYEAASSSGGWEQMLQTIARATNASVGGLIIGGNECASDIVVSTGADSAALGSYAHYYHQIDPVMPRLLETDFGEVVTQRMVVNRHEMVRTEFYNDWMRPLDIDDCLATRITNMSNPGILAFAVPARRETFDAGAIRLVRLLLPHLQAAVRTHLHLHGLTLQRNGALAALDQLGRPVLFVDDSGCVVLTNHAANQLLSQADGLSGGGRAGLQAATADQTTRLRRLIAQASGLVGDLVHGGSMALDRPSGEWPFIVTVIPLSPEGQLLLPSRGARAMVLVATPSDDVPVSQQVLQSVFGMTPAEAKVARAVMRGGGVKAAAAALGVAPSTVRTHLLRIFAKTGTTRQAELIRCIGHLAVMPAS